MPSTFPQITHHGATSGVTGACHQLCMQADASLLVDFGLFQGAETSGTGAGAASLQIEFDLAGILALVATHVHSFRDERLNVHWPLLPTDAQEKIEVRRQDYNEGRPQSSIVDLISCGYRLVHLEVGNLQINALG